MTQTESEVSLDMTPAGDVAIVHEHETAVREGVAIGVGEVAFSGGADVSEDEGRGGFGGEAGEIDAIPCWNSGGEFAGRWPKTWSGVIAYAKTVAIVGTSMVLIPGFDERQVIDAPIP